MGTRYSEVGDRIGPCGAAGSICTRDAGWTACASSIATCAAGGGIVTSYPAGMIGGWV
jgi:hypothetical protein